MLIIYRGFHWEQNKILSQPFLYHFEWWHSTCLDSFCFFYRNQTALFYHGSKEAVLTFVFVCLWADYVSFWLVSKPKRDLSCNPVCLFQSKFTDKIITTQCVWNLVNLLRLFWGQSQKAAVRRYQMGVALFIVFRTPLQLIRY